MQLHAAVVPPPGLLAEAGDVLRALSRPVPQEEGRRSRIGLRSRRPPAGVPQPALDLLDPALVLLPVTSFGNVTPGDAARIAAAVGEELSRLPRPVVRAHGGVALEPIGDDRVQVRLSGDEAGLRAVARAVVASAERVGIFCDRRAFTPLLPLARINDATTEADLEAALAALEALEGRSWTVDHVSLLQRPKDARTEPSREVERIPVGVA